MPKSVWSALGCAIVSLISFTQLTAQEVTIFEVRKNLPLSDKEKVYRDFYINAGTEAGLKPGVVITVTRRQTMYDAYQNRSAGELMVPVGEIKLIHTQKGMSVGRIHNINPNSAIPVLEYESIMIGDRVDLSTARASGKSAMEEGSEPAAPAPVEEKKTASVRPFIKLEAAEMSSTADQNLAPAQDLPVTSPN